MADDFKMRWPLALIPLAIIFLAVMFGGLALEPPPLRTSQSAETFNAQAAIERLGRVLGDETPHPTDSAAQDEVRARLLAEIEAIGISPQVEDTFACRPQERAPWIDCGLVRNILFSIGPPNAPPILAATHYDSVPAAPGASDAGIGMAVWLEIARMLKDAPLERRIQFLFTDGEEPGLFGAYVFARDPRMDDIESLVNLEARGSRGPAIFFESNLPNADAVRAFASAPRPVASSVMADAYRLMTNFTDVTVLTRPGLDVVNIALLDGLEDYHTPQDSLASQDPRSVQHMGDMALAVTRALAGGPDRDENATLVYTDIASRAFVTAPVLAGQGLLVVALIVSLIAFWRTGGEGRWRALAAPLVAVLLAAVLSFGVGFLLNALRGELYWYAYPAATRAWCTLLALFAVVAALLVLRVRERPEQIEASGMAWFALIGFGASFVSPGISVLFGLPLVFYVLGVLVALAWKPARLIGAALAALVALIVWTPALHLTELALGYDLTAAFSLLVALLSLTVLGLLVRAHAAQTWRGVTATALAATLIAAGAAFVAPAATATIPQPLNISSFVDTESGEAYALAGSTTRPVPPELAGAAPFTARFVLPGDRVETWTTPIETDGAPAPALEEVTLTEEEGGRVVRARLVMNGAYRASIRFARTAGPVSASLNGVVTNFTDVAPITDFVSLACLGRACDGAPVEIRLAQDGDLGEWYLIGQYPGRIEAGAEALRSRRPERFTPIQNGDGTLTLSRVTPQIQQNPGAGLATEAEPRH
jgi:hypothetical protein